MKNFFEDISLGDDLILALEEYTTLHDGFLPRNTFKISLWAGDGETKFLDKLAFYEETTSL